MYHQFCTTKESIFNSIGATVLITAFVAVLIDSFAFPHVRPYSEIYATYPLKQSVSATRKFVTSQIGNIDPFIGYAIGNIKSSTLINCSTSIVLMKDNEIISSLFSNIALSDNYKTVFSMKDTYFDSIHFVFDADGRFVDDDKIAVRFIFGSLAAQNRKMLLRISFFILALFFVILKSTYFMKCYYTSIIPDLLMLLAVLATNPFIVTTCSLTANIFDAIFIRAFLCMCRYAASVDLIGPDIRTLIPIIFASIDFVIGCISDSFLVVRINDNPTDVSIKFTVFNIIQLTSLLLCIILADVYALFKKKISFFDVIGFTLLCLNEFFTWISKELADSTVLYSACLSVPVVYACYFNMSKRSNEQDNDFNKFEDEVPIENRIIEEEGIMETNNI